MLDLTEASKRKRESRMKEKQAECWQAAYRQELGLTKVKPYEIRQRSCEANGDSV